MSEVKLDGYLCDRCSHTWVSRNLNGAENEKPRVCPKCKSPYWNIPRKNGSSGEEIKSAVSSRPSARNSSLRSRLLVNNSVKLDSTEAQIKGSLFPPRKKEKEVLNLFPPK